MIAIILAAVFGGMKLDETLQTAQPYWTLVTTVLGVGLSMYVVIRDFTR